MTTQKYCDCPEPCNDCKEANYCDLCDLPIWDVTKYGRATAF